MSRLYQRDLDGGGGDSFLHALLGLIALGKRLDAALAELEPAPQRRAGKDAHIDLLLGLVSLWKRVSVELGRWCAPVRRSRALERPVTSGFAELTR